MHGQHENRDVAHAAEDAGRGFDAVDAGKADVDDDDVRLQPQGGLDRALAVTHVFHDLDLRLGLENLAKPLPHEQVVFHQ